MTAESMARYVVIAMFGRYRVIDRGDGSKILPANWKTRKAAERWVERHARPEGA